MSKILFIEKQDNVLINANHIIYIRINALGILAKLVNMEVATLGLYKTADRAAEVLAELGQKLRYNKVNFISMPKE